MTRRPLVQTAALCGLSASVLVTAGCSGGRTFATPDEAMLAVAEVTGKHDEESVEEIFGRGAAGVLFSGDPVADREDGRRVGEMILERVEFTQSEAPVRTVAVVGEEQWPFPIPLVRAADGWRFDLAAGREEVLNRRIGRNELHTIETLHAFVDAQREYASVGRDGGPPAYARKLWSTEGMHDGLYWPPGEGEPDSPLGPLVAEAATEGYARSEEGPKPFHGYHYRILTAQGPGAPGGPRSYIDSQGRMTGGFAAIAWPASYGNSGVMTFIVNQVGVVFQKDLGPRTGAAAASIMHYDPDDTWEPTG